MEIKIEKMKASDLDEVCQIEKKVFADAWPKKAFEDDIGNELAYPLIARFENKVAGYASLYHVYDELQIGNLAVSPDFHRRGIATKIMDEVLKLAEELSVRLLVLEVRPSNEAAQKLYFKYGFKRAGERKYYYRNPTENALILVRGVG